MKTREQLNTETYQQAVKFAQSFAEELKTEYLNEATERYQFEQSQFEQSYSEAISQKKEKLPPLVMLLMFAMLLVMSGAIYWQSGRYQIVQKGEQMHQAFQVQFDLEQKEQKNERYILNLQDRLRQNPNDGNLWYELGQAYALNNDFTSALICYDNAQKVLGEKAAILGAMATADYYQHKQTLTEQAEQWIEKALALDAKESSSLLLLASNAFRNKDYTKAIDYWRKVLDSENESIDRRAVIQSIQMARQMQYN